MNLLKRLGMFALALVLAAPAAAQERYPSKRLNWTIAFGPGGGNDIMSRTLISILEKYKLYPENIVPENRPGGSGATGWGYVFSQKGDPYHVSTTSGSFITTPLQANTPWQPGSFTPVALLASDDATNATLTTRNVMSCEMFITGRTLGNAPGLSTDSRPGIWAVDASVDASTNPLVIVRTAIRAGKVITAYLTIRCRHSYDW